MEYTTHILPVHQRMAELYTINQLRQLTEAEFNEMAMCLKVNAKYCWELAYAQNMAYMEAVVYGKDE
ncbi:hypothetical protein F4V43_02225 [Paenibacillus spiritus]|uniref:Phage protein n=1 Tax=Paenibacillus spiritus TaxID=2496557 RepID=A0A5J5GHY1_9BACL|nr:hypothetical protein [Paenibacillus spiritus]KAA9007323.1 hypothetical protein F4V43_02225 [Paenibacillus spiritus]